MGILSMLVKLGIDSSQFEMGIKRAQSLGQKFGSSFKSAVSNNLSNAFSVASVKSFADSIVELADNIGDLSEQLNISTDDVQKFQVLASESGVKFEAIASAINRINDAKTAAAKGDGPQRNAMLRAGFSLQEIKDQSETGSASLVKLGERLNANRNNTDMMAAATDLLGLKLVKAAMAAGKLKNLGPISLFKQEDIEALGKYDDAVKRLDRTLKIAAAPALISVTDPLERRLKMFEGINNKAGFIPALLAVGASLPSFVSEMILGTKKKPEDVGPKALQPTTNRFANDNAPRAPFALGGSSDAITRIGGFTGFESGQDRAVRQAIEQTVQLRMIAVNTANTANTMQFISRE